MIVGCHVVEKEVFFDKYIGLLFIDVIFVLWGQTVIFTWKTEFIEDLDHCILEFQSFFFIHFRW